MKFTVLFVFLFSVPSFAGYDLEELAKGWSNKDKKEAEATTSSFGGGGALAPLAGAAIGAWANFLSHNTGSTGVITQGDGGVANDSGFVMAGPGQGEVLNDSGFVMAGPGQGEVFNDSDFVYHAGDGGLALESTDILGPQVSAKTSDEGSVYGLGANKNAYAGGGGTLGHTGGLTGPPRNTGGLAFDARGETVAPATNAFDARGETVAPATNAFDARGETVAPITGFGANTNAYADTGGYPKSEGGVDIEFAKTAPGGEGEWYSPTTNAREVERDFGFGDGGLAWSPEDWEAFDEAASLMSSRNIQILTTLGVVASLAGAALAKSGGKGAVAASAGGIMHPEMADQMMDLIDRTFSRKAPILIEIDHPSITPDDVNAFFNMESEEQERIVEEQVDPELTDFMKTQVVPAILKKTLAQDCAGNQCA